MAYNEGVAQRVREAMQEVYDIAEKKMFGGLAFMVRGNICCGIVRSELMLRVGPEQYEEALELPHARKMDFTGKPMKGLIYVAEEGFEDDSDLEMWVNRALRFIDTLPAK